MDGFTEDRLAQEGPQRLSIHYVRSTAQETGKVQSERGILENPYRHRGIQFDEHIDITPLLRLTTGH